MIVKAKVQSTSQGKDGITTLVIVTKEIDDNIDWVGMDVQIKKVDYMVNEIEEKF